MVAGSTSLRRLVRLEVLDHALGDQKDSIHKADRQQQIEIHTDQIDPEIADGFGGMAGNAAHQSRGDGNARGGRDEVVKDEAHHLREIGQGRLARRNSASWCWW